MTDLTTESKELREALVEVEKKKRKRKLILVSVAAITVLLLLLGIWFSGYVFSKNAAADRIKDLEDKVNELANTPVVVEPVTPEIVQSVLDSKISEISELASAEYLFTNAAKFTDTKGIIGFFDWMTEKSFIQKWDGSIKAGINMEKISVSVEDTTITITMPKAEILSYEIDYNSVEVLDEKSNIFNPISVEDSVQFDTETSEAMKARAIENGLLDRAQANAQNIISNLLTASVKNIENYTITFVVAES